MTSIPYPLTGDLARAARQPLTLNAPSFRRLFDAFGPSLGLWRGAEIAALRACTFTRPVLDLGCGDGVVTSFVLPRVDIGVDPWPKAIARARGSGVYETLEQATVEETRLPDASVRTVISNSVLEHLENIDEVLRVAARLLVPGGRLIFTVPTERFGEWLALPSTRYGAWRNRMYEHRNTWTVAEWSQHLGRAGLEIEDVRPYLRRAHVMSWDLLELAQRVWIGQRRVFGEIWKRLPSPVMDGLARAASRLDLSAPPPGGGRLIVARRLVS